MTVKQSLIDEAGEILTFTKSKDIKFFCEGVIEFLEYNFLDDEIQRKCYERGDYWKKHIEDKTFYDDINTGEL